MACTGFLVFTCCARNSAYQIGTDVPSDMRKLMVNHAEKGKVLYKSYCSGCHGIFSQGKDGVPNFTRTQVDNYNAVALLGMDPLNHAVAKKMTHQQINYVMTFLRIRKPS